MLHGCCACVLVASMRLCICSIGASVLRIHLPNVGSISDFKPRILPTCVVAALACIIFYPSGVAACQSTHATVVLEVAASRQSGRCVPISLFHCWFCNSHFGCPICCPYLRTSFAAWRIPSLFMGGVQRAIARARLRNQVITEMMANRIVKRV